MIKALRKKIANMLRVLADKISGEVVPKENYKPIHDYGYRRLTDKEIEEAWRRAFKKVGPFKFPEGVDIFK